MHDLIEPVLQMAERLPCEQLPALMGELEQVRCVALARLTTQTMPASSDELLEPGEAAQKLKVSLDYLYRHSSQFPFTRRLGKALRFSKTGIEDYIRENGLTAKRRSSTIAPAPIRGAGRRGK